VEATYPRVVDPDAEEPKPVHVRSTPWGRAWPPDAPSVCGVRPANNWHQVRGSVTCDECAELLSTEPMWKDAVLRPQRQG